MASYREKNPGKNKYCPPFPFVHLSLSMKGMPGPKGRGVGGVGGARPRF